jgi:TBC1 domain family member 10
MLQRILNAVANYYPEIGYVQGMNFIVASLMLFVNNEEDTFFIMIQLLRQFKLKELYLKNFKKLKLLCF